VREQQIRLLQEREKLIDEAFEEQAVRDKNNQRVVRVEEED
jgi:hypothetical protein